VIDEVQHQDAVLGDDADADDRPQVRDDVATTVIGFGSSLYAINSHVFDLIYGDPALVQSEVVRLWK